MPVGRCHREAVRALQLAAARTPLHHMRAALPPPAARSAPEEGGGEIFSEDGHRQARLHHRLAHLRHRMAASTAHQRARHQQERGGGTAGGCAPRIVREYGGARQARGRPVGPAWAHPGALDPAAPCRSRAPLLSRAGGPGRPVERRREGGWHRQQTGSWCACTNEARRRARCSVPPAGGGGSGGAPAAPACRWPAPARSPGCPTRPARTWRSSGRPWRGRTCGQESAAVICGLRADW